AANEVHHAGLGPDMRKRTVAGLVALLALGACREEQQVAPDERCDATQVGELRCKDNSYESCSRVHGDEFRWIRQAECVPPQECRIDDAGGHVAILPYCYAPGSTCNLGGFSQCDESGLPSPAVWTCSPRPSDDTLQWMVTTCEGRMPPAICLPDGVWVEQWPPPTACHEVTAPCPLEPLFPYPAATCDGDVRLQCRPVVVDGKAVFVVEAEDCKLEHRVCRAVGSEAGCVMP
ncbi:MAG: hypothetical protein H6Q88_1815, partial [Anaeromyxobacteraceae bacterium]|nr:hypothetical protein [Anaeromyxobacteraceae bacterium]